MYVIYKNKKILSGHNILDFCGYANILIESFTSVLCILQLIRWKNPLEDTNWNVNSSFSLNSDLNLLKSQANSFIKYLSS